MRSLAGLTALTVLGLATASAAAGEAGSTIVVAQDGSGDVASVGEAVAAAADGDTILARPGMYAEAVTLVNDVDLYGDGPVDSIIITFGDGQTPVLTIEGSDATVANLTLQGADSLVLVSGGAPTLDGIVFDGVGTLEPTEGGCHAVFGPTGCKPVALRLDGTAARIIGSTFRDSGEIRVQGGAAPLMEGNEMSGGSHVFLEEPGDDTVMRSNDMHDVDLAGIAIYSTGRPLIEGNVIATSGGAGIEVGLQLAPGIEPTIRGNTITDSAVGIQVAQGATPLIEANVLTGNGSGIIITGSDAAITDDRLEGNASGVFVMQGSPVLSGNTIVGGTVGLGLGGDAAVPILSGNTICDNETNLNLIMGAELPPTIGDQACPDG